MNWPPDVTTVPSPSTTVTVSVYDEVTGIIVSVLSCPRRQLAGNVGPGFGYVEGRHDYRNRRVDVLTKEVIPYQPPAPDADHVWNAATELWELPPPILNARINHGAALRAMERLEFAQNRIVREFLLGDMTQVEARAKLRLIDNAIVELRSQLL